MSVPAKSGDTVAVHYTGKLTDGSVFGTSKNREPVRFVVGEQNVIPGFDKAVLGMSPGETKTAKIGADEAYGSRKEELIVEFPRDQVPPDVPVEVGQSMQVQTNGGQSLSARVVDLSESAVTLDANHPLAGEELTFDIELVELVGSA